MAAKKAPQQDTATAPTKRLNQEAHGVRVKVSPASEYFERSRLIGKGKLRELKIFSKNIPVDFLAEELQPGDIAHLKADEHLLVQTLDADGEITDDEAEAEQAIIDEQASKKLEQEAAEAQVKADAEALKRAMANR